MKISARICALALTLVLIGAQAASAHAPPVGPHSGAQVNAGPYHVEVLVDGRDVAVWVTNHGGAVPHGADNLSVTARLAGEDGIETPVLLRAETPGLFVGQAERSLRKPSAGTLEIRTPAGTVVRAAFR